MYHQCDFYFYNLTSVFCVDMLLNESIRTFSYKMTEIQHSNDKRDLNDKFESSKLDQVSIFFKCKTT